MNIIDRFMVSLGFHVEREGLEKFEKQTENLRDAALKVGAVMTIAAVGIGAFVDKVTEGMNEVYEFAELNQQSAKSIDAMRFAGLEFGVTADSMQESLGNLNIKLGESLANVGRGAMIFKRLGLSAKDSNGHVRTLGDMLDVLAAKMQGNNRSKNIAIASRLGMDPHVVLMLEQGAESMRKLREEAEKLVPSSDEDYEQAHRAELLMTQTHWMLQMISREIAGRMLPYVVKALEYFQRWFKEMRQGTEGKFTKALEVLGATIGTMWDWMVRVANATREALHWLGQFRFIVWAAGIVTALLLSYKMTAWFLDLTQAVGHAVKAMLEFDFAAALPAVAMGALLLAIGLLVDDLYNFYHGGDSLIGQLSTKYPHAIQIAWVALTGLIGLFVALKWAAITSLTESIVLVGMYAAEWIVAAAAMAIATAEIWVPVLLVVAALGLVVAGIWYVWKNWDKITAFMGKAWNAMVDGLKVGVMWLEGKINSLANAAGQLAAKIPGGRSVFKWETGHTLDAHGNLTKPIFSSVTPTSKGAVIGRTAAGPNVTHVDASTHHNPIQVITSNPEQAGQNVKKVLDRRDRKSIRNAQSAVSY